MATELEALAWAAGRAGVSYGKFVAGMKESEAQRYVREFQAWKEARRHEAAGKASLCGDDP